MAANTFTSVTSHSERKATLSFEITNFSEELASKGRGEGLTSDTITLGGGLFSCSVFPAGDSRCQASLGSCLHGKSCIAKLGVANLALSQAVA